MRRSYMCLERNTFHRIDNAKGRDISILPAKVRSDCAWCFSAFSKAQMKASEHFLHIRVSRDCLLTAAGTKLTELKLFEQDWIV